MKTNVVSQNRCDVHQNTSLQFTPCNGRSLYGFPISCLVNVAASRLFGDQTRMSAWVPDALREVRLWSHSTPGCPWILLAGIGLLLACCCWCLGFLSGALAFSLRCRRCVGHSLQLLVVARAVAGPAPTTDLTPELRALVLETSSPLALAALPVPLLDLKAPLLRSQHSVWSGRARLGRAFRAGIIAKIRLDGDLCELSSPSIPQRNAFYICLRCSRYPRGFWSSSYQSYIELIGTRGSSSLESGSISHAFPSKVEAEVYAAGANQPWPIEVWDGLSLERPWKGCWQTLHPKDFCQKFIWPCLMAQESTQHCHADWCMFGSMVLCWSFPIIQMSLT